MVHILLLLALLVLLPLQALHSQIPSNVPTDGLVGWWPFNGNSMDESGNGNNALAFGPRLTLDRNGKPDAAYAFDGVSDYITIPYSSHFQFLLNGSYTINFFMRNLSSITSGAEADNEVPFSLGDYCARHENRGIRVHLVSPDQLGFDVRGNGGDEQTSSCITANSNVGQWQMITLIRDYGVVVKLYVNGLLVDEAPDTAGETRPFDEQRDIEIGREINLCGNEDNHHFYGDIDDIGIWNRTLTDEEVFRLYNCDLGISSDSILGYRKVETHQVVTYALRNNPKLSYKWIASGGYMLGESTNHFCDVIWGYDKTGSVCCIVSDSVCTDTICVTTTINNSPTGGIAGDDIETPTMSVKPNPASDMIDISTAMGEQFAHYELVDVTGVVVQRTEGIAVRMSVTDVAPGVYHIVQRDTMGNIIGMQRVVVKR